MLREPGYTCGPSAASMTKSEYAAVASLGLLSSRSTSQFCTTVEFEVRARFKFKGV